MRIGWVDSCAVVAAAAATVMACGGGDPAPSAIRINPPELLLGVDQTAELAAFFVVEGSSERAEGVTWTVAGGGVATVTGGDDGATVTGVAPGETMVTAAADGLSGSAMISVRPVPAIVDTSPADGATAVMPPVDVEVTFSVAMDDGLTAQTAAGACSGAIQLSSDGFATCVGFTATPVLGGGDTIATLTPGALAADTTFQIRVTTEARSAEGIALPAAFVQATGFRTAPAEPCATGLVISQIYGGGGGAGAPYTHDFIELHNAGTAPVALGGMAIQYAGAGGTGAWGAQALPAVSVPPGGYFLIREAAGAGAGAALPTPDFVPGVPINLAPTAGKVALTSTTTALDGVCPTANVLDRVGYGAANCFEGSAPAPAISNTTAAQRRGLGCIDASENDTDFVVAAPAPRNAATAPSACQCAL